MNAHSYEGGAKLRWDADIAGVGLLTSRAYGLHQRRIWQQVSDEAQQDNEDGFRTHIEPVSDPAFDRVTWETVKAAVPANSHGASALLIADSATLTLPDHPILVVDLLNSRDKPPFRCIPSELWTVDNNLNIANMDWEEFASAVDEEGVWGINWRPSSGTSSEPRSAAAPDLASVMATAPVEHDV